MSAHIQHKPINGPSLLSTQSTEVPILVIRGTIYYRHYMEMYPAMIDWLDNTCNLKAPTAAAAN